MTKPIVARIIVSLVLENVIIRAAVLFSEILWLWLNRNKFCDHLTKPIITRIIVSLAFENLIRRIEIIVFRDFMTLVKYVQILSLFNQAHYYTNYCVFSVGKCYYKGCCIVFRDFLRLWLNRNKFCHYLTSPIITRIIKYLVFENVIIRIEIIVLRDFMTLVK